MLKQRIITALLMLAVLLPALFASGPEPFCAITLVLIVGGCWEWARLNGCGPVAAVLSGGVAGAVLGLLWWSVGLLYTPPWWWQVAGGVWVALTVFVLNRGVAGWAALWRPARLLLGWVLIGLAWWAMARARYMGSGMLLSILCLVWMADIAAYFGGKAFGRRKLAPAISPGKSWEGVYSGLLGVLLLALVWGAGELQGWWSGPSLYGHLWALGPVAAVLGLVFLVTMSVCGDLLESLVKRSAGVKDSSGLLPGHGGVLDRVDALLPVLPLAMMLASYA